MQHACNTDMMVQCVECEKWRLIFAKKKLTKNQKQQLTDLLTDIEYTCCFQFGKNMFAIILPLIFTLFLIFYNVNYFLQLQSVNLIF